MTHLNLDELDASVGIKTRTGLNSEAEKRRQEKRRKRSSKRLKETDKLLAAGGDDNA